MEYRNFQLKTVLRVSIIFLTLIFITLALSGDQNYVTLAVLVTLLIIELIELFSFISRINREIGLFIKAIYEEDYSLNYAPSSRDRIFRTLRMTLGRVMKDIQQAKEKETRQKLYLQMLIDHLDSGVLVYDSSFKPELQNSFARKLFPAGVRIEILTEDHPAIAEFITTSKAGDRQLVILEAREDHLQLLMRKSGFSMNGKEYHLVSLMDIHMELDSQELDSWSKLIRVLTHEIMNSVTPVNSLSGAMLDQLKEIQSQNKNLNLEDVFVSAETIYQRSRDLMKFISDYKQLTRKRIPELTKVNLCELADETVRLFEKELETKKIELQKEYSESVMYAEIDREMIGRVLINIMQNAMDAIETKEEEGLISLKIFERQEKKHVRITDNGEGIKEEYLDEIFIPFFTTREKGSGIGLSLSRQIMHMHNGSLNVKSEVSKGSSITLIFP